MSILKAILHHWNKTNKEYDILHPETESAQITDWHSGIMASLASTTLGTVVSAVTTDSVLGKLIKMLLDASGVKYLIDTNGYVCFGSLFGGLILQWILVESESKLITGTLPVSFSNKCLVCTANDTGEGCISLGVSALTSTYTVYQAFANLTIAQAIFVGY